MVKREITEQRTPGYSMRKTLQKYVLLKVSQYRQNIQLAEDSALRSTPVIVLNNKTNILLGQFVPSKKYLLEITERKMAKHRLTHILCDENLTQNFLWNLTFKFGPDFVCPPKGTYHIKPQREIEIPSNIDLICSLKFSKMKRGEDIEPYAFVVYSLAFQSGNREKVVEIIKPRDQSKYHISTESVELQLGERIVSAKVDVDKQPSCRPCQVTFLVYDFI